MRFFKSSLIIVGRNRFVNIFCPRKTLSTEKLFVWINYVNILIRSRRKGRNVWIIPSNCGIIVDNFVEIRPSVGAAEECRNKNMWKKLDGFCLLVVFAVCFAVLRLSFGAGGALGQISANCP